MSEWTQPPTEKLRGVESMLAGYAQRLGAWRIRIGTHYPATLWALAAAFVIVGMMAVTSLLIATGAPLPAWLTLGPLLGGVLGLAPGFVLIAVVFNLHCGIKCECDECKGDLR